MNDELVPFYFSNIHDIKISGILILKYAQVNVFCPSTMCYCFSLYFLSSGHCICLFVMFMGMISKHTNVQWGVEQDTCQLFIYFRGSWSFLKLDLTRQLT